MSGFRKAKTEQAALKMALYGPPGSGKTMTCLLCAEGLARVTGKRVAYVDTEQGTAFYSQSVAAREFHPEGFDFDVLNTRSLSETTKAVRELDFRIHCVAVVDSISHLWDAPILAYSGKRTSIDTIPFHAWAGIKKPYKELISFLMNSPMHVFIAGRQKTVYGEDDAGELKALGVTMRAEGETPYEPHILLRMEAIRQKKGQAIISAFAEKDRTGILAGKTIHWPNYASLCEPLLPLLGLSQAQMPTEAEVAAHDAEQLDLAERQRQQQSETLVRQWLAKIDLCDSAAALKNVGKLLTPAEKAKMLPAHVSALREHYQEIERKLNGVRETVPVEG